MPDQKGGLLPGDLFNFLLETEGKRAVRYTYFFSILTVQLDPSEKHSVPPSVLPQLIQQSIRTTDWVGTAEDHRFCIILHHAETQGSYEVGERIRRRIASYNFSPEKTSAHRTVSVGGACFPTHTPDIQNLVSTAQKMLLKAQSDGGNQVCLPA